MRSLRSHRTPAAAAALSFIRQCDWYGMGASAEVQDTAMERPERGLLRSS